MSPDSKPGAATPYSLYKMYKAQGAVMANPCTLRQHFGFSATSMPPLRGMAQPTGTMQFTMQTLGTQARRAESRGGGARVRSNSPPRMQFKVIQAGGADPCHTASVTLSLASLRMR